MADIYIKGATTSRERVGNNQRVLATGTRDGALYTARYALAAALEGKLFSVRLGEATTPTTFRVGYDADQPEIAIDVPTGTAIIPVEIGVYLEDSGGTDTEMVAEASPALTGAGTSTTGTIISNRLNSGQASACTYRYTYSGNGTAPASYVEFWRAGYPFADATGNPAKLFAWLMEHAAPLVLVGPASLLLHISGTGTAPAGYAKVSWIEELAANL